MATNRQHEWLYGCAKEQSQICCACCGWQHLQPKRQKAGFRQDWSERQRWAQDAAAVYALMLQGCVSLMSESGVRDSCLIKHVQSCAFKFCQITSSVVDLILYKLCWCLLLPVMSELKVHFPSFEASPRLSSHITLPVFVIACRTLIGFTCVLFSSLPCVFQSTKCVFFPWPDTLVLALLPHLELVLTNCFTERRCLLHLHLGPKLMVPGSVHSSKALQLTYAEEACWDKI